MSREIYKDYELMHTCFKTFTRDVKWSTESSFSDSKDLNGLEMGRRLMFNRNLPRNP